MLLDFDAPAARLRQQRRRMSAPITVFVAR
jgi:hypothetical protein